MMFPADKLLRVGVLSNPKSGGNRKGLGAIRDILNPHPDTLHRRIENLADTEAALDEFRRNEVEVVAINGGDGTVQTVLTALFHCQPYEKLPLLALLRAGTDSIIARDVGIRGSRERGLRKLLYWVRTRDGKSVILKRPIMRVQMSSQPQPFFGMIFGAAAIYQGIRFCRRSIHSLGLHGELAPGLTLARFLLGVVRKKRQYVNAVPVTIGLDQNSPLQDDFLLVLVSTVERFFLGIRPYWGVESRPLHFTALTERAQYLLRVLPTMARGQDCRHRTPQNGYFSHNANEVRLKLNSGFTLDGELHTVEPRTEEVVINCGGQASFLRL
ncbi:MAG: hypothetical protein JSV31_18200 [Desulfobacterales bacterium]|nr:MAG: hypothetical protein JSV31_18200 [Desulfobacterales bacterium]